MVINSKMDPNIQTLNQLQITDPIIPTHHIDNHFEPGKGGPQRGVNQKRTRQANDADMLKKKPRIRLAATTAAVMMMMILIPSWSSWTSHHHHHHHQVSALSSSQPPLFSTAVTLTPPILGLGAVLFPVRGTTISILGEEDSDNNNIRQDIDDVTDFFVDAFWTAKVGGGVKSLSQRQRQQLEQSQQARTRIKSSNNHLSVLPLARLVFSKDKMMIEVKYWPVLGLKWMEYLMVPYVVVPLYMHHS
jgi:hypothetical protein